MVKTAKKIKVQATEHSFDSRGGLIAAGWISGVIKQIELDKKCLSIEEFELLIRALITCGRYVKTGPWREKSYGQPGDLHYLLGRDIALALLNRDYNSGEINFIITELVKRHRRTARIGCFNDTILYAQKLYGLPMEAIKIIKDNLGPNKKLIQELKI